MEIQFQGAAREVTGSCHVVRANGKTILLDCGLFQGKRVDVQRKNETLPLDAQEQDAQYLSKRNKAHADPLYDLRCVAHHRVVVRVRCHLPPCALTYSQDASL